ncbi:glycoside hydrolase family 31 protein [Aspergillus clavatus NRRL 1]|uniref:Alpha-glucosidase n=1 Tax=Aspergillus clavatus (strain ATCC 1007 / CBS 513.65 / DSM 816 / NCTC 3887 / NRRL 1 / QM 1276 / 107) TaxID=344612 RepID=A1CHW0_ASPCL|nr:alpha-glucosidase AgdA, putative [Aspergillus clavatus NRRL 1]EAW10465.1 alpha-glucosidase AgdA, putative [Aspergillus clavatus NRRL 1]
MASLVGLLASAWLLPSTYGAAVHSFAPSTTATAAYSQHTLPSSIDNGAQLIANIDDPLAVNAQSVCPGYKASDVQQTSRGFTASLQLAGEPCNAYGIDVDSLSLSVEVLAKDRLNIQIVPTHVDSSNASWYILPEDRVPKAQASADASVSQSDFEIEWSNDPSFNIKIIRKATGDALFDTADSVLVFQNQFIEFVSALPEGYNLYGLGERMAQLRLLRNATLTTYAADVGDPIDDNIYGQHPFYLDTRYYTKDANGSYSLVNTDDADASGDYESFSHGVFLRNAHGQEVILQSRNITWRTIGGSIDLTFYSGPTQADVTKSYQLTTIGLPAMQQYSALGFHQCRWGYRSWSELEEVVNTFEQFEIPLEYIWTDIDYMRGYRDFDNDQVHFPYDEGEEFLDRLHKSGRHWVPIVDSAIYIPNPDNASDAYDTYARGAKDDVFIKNPDGSLYIGAVWPGFTVFPDWHNPKAAEWWSNELVTWFEKVQYDGIWIDMSEVSSFCVGSCGTGNLHLNPAHPPFQLPGEPGNIEYTYPEAFNVTNSTEAASASAASASQSSAAAATQTDVSSTTTSYLRTTPTPGVRDINYPPYVINHVQSGHDLAVHAISPNATHVDGVQEYDVHSLWGHQILNATYQGLLEVFTEKRPFIIGRSTFAGSGKWAGHWGGDNNSRWGSMFHSISQALSFSLFGIPMFGVDTCGFNGNTDEELCNRWMQLSAFFPFYRNHNTLAALSQEPYRWASVTEAAKTAMSIRYALLPYFYTLFHQAHTTGSTVMRALAWEFPNDPSLAAVDTQFMVGPSILVTPVLEPLAKTVKGVFPGVGKGQVWYDWYTQAAVDAKPGVNTTIPAPLGHIPVYVRGGSILPMQEPALTTRDARKTPWSLLAALDGNQTASGQLYLDDGSSVNPSSTLNVEFAATHSSIKVSAKGDWREKNSLDSVTVLGVAKEPARVTFNRRRVPPESVEYNATSQVLTVSGLQKLTPRGAWAEDWILKW